MFVLQVLAHMPWLLVNASPYIHSLSHSSCGFFIGTPKNDNHIHDSHSTALLLHILIRYSYIQVHVHEYMEAIYIYIYIRHSSWQLHCHSFGSFCDQIFGTVTGTLL